MSETNITFAKIVANPSIYSWSQVYNAGKLFAVLSLEKDEESEEKDYLNVLGKEILDTLEQEFFTLETKDLDSIKEAVFTTSQKIPQDISCSFVVGCFVNNILYIYIVGNGKVSLKREGHLGNLLEVSDHKPDSLKVASGFLQDLDVVVLQTKQFSNIISAETLSEFLDNLAPSEAAENLAPLVHEKEEPGAASIIISYKSPVKEENLVAPFNKTEEEPVEKEETEQKTPQSPFYSSQINNKSGFLDKIKPLTSIIKLPKRLDLNHSRKVILTIVIIIVLVFIGSISFAVKKQEDTKTQAAFNSIYPQAQKKYDEGQGLIELNQNLARDSFTQAKQIIDGGKDKLPKGSKEEKQVLTLLAKVNTALSQTSGVTQTQAKEVESSLSPLLLSETKNTGLYFSEDDKNIYGVTDNEVFTLNKEGSSKKTIIENEDSWGQAGGLATYNGNVYVLDKKQNQILKFVATSDGFSESNYFSSTKPDFSNAFSMAIDSSVYVLSTDGTVNKFTKGNEDNFSVSRLDSAFLNPTRIFTNASTDNIYILDNGNSRVVVLDKSGAYKSQYQADVIKNAKDFDVSESDKKIYILSGGKVYQIDLK